MLRSCCTMLITVHGGPLAGKRCDGLSSTSSCSAGENEYENALTR